MARFRVFSRDKVHRHQVACDPCTGGLYTVPQLGFGHRHESLAHKPTVLVRGSIASMSPVANSPQRGNKEMWKRGRCYSVLQREKEVDAIGVTAAAVVVVARSVVWPGETEAFPLDVFRGEVGGPSPPLPIGVRRQRLGPEW